MSKIICEICGTAYPETSTQCPICGYVRPVDAAGIAAETSEGEPRTYTYVKGGRFSKANVKKRNRAKQKADGKQQTVVAGAARQRAEQPKKTKKNAGLIIVAILLLLLVLAFVLFLIIKLFWPELPELMPEQNSTEQSESTDLVIACESIELDADEVTLTQIGAARMIYATPSPADTTDTVKYRSTDESVATVTDSGKVVAVGPGEATIEITCGDIQVTCDVICQIETETEATTESTEETTEVTEETTEPTEETTQTTEEPTDGLSLSEGDIPADIMLFSVGENWLIYKGDVDKSLITWSSDNPQVATFENGVVKAVGKGTTWIHAEYNGVKISCIVRCNF